MQNRKYYLFIIIATLFVIKAEEIPEPYRSINILPEDLHGWLTDINKKYLKQIIHKLNPTLIVELGTWLGKSALFMAEVSNEHCKIFAIDDWTASTDSSIQHDHQACQKLKNLYQQFLSNVIHHGFTAKIIPIRKKTVEAALSLKINPDLIYVDASHEEENVYQDIMHWYPKLKIGGVMCGDDWDAPSIKKGVFRAAKELNVSALGDASFWWFPGKSS